MPMWPTFAEGTSAKTPSSIPVPALSIGTNASFLPEITLALAMAIGVSISTSSRGRIFFLTFASETIRFLIPEKYGELTKQYDYDKSNISTHFHFCVGKQKFLSAHAQKNAWAGRETATCCRHDVCNRSKIDNLI